MKHNLVRRYPLRRMVYKRLFDIVDHDLCQSYLSQFPGGRFHGICKWRNAHQRRLAGRYATQAWSHE